MNSKFSIICCLIIILFFSFSCSERKIRKEYKAETVKLYENENIIKREPLIYKIENNLRDAFTNKCLIDNISSDEMLLKVVLKQNIKYKEYIADEYIVKEKYINGGKYNLVESIPMIALLYIPFGIPIGILEELSKKENSVLKDFKKDFIGGTVQYEIELERIHKNKKPTNETKTFIKDWKNAKLKTIISNQEFQFTSNENGILFIDMVDLLKKMSSIPEQFEMQFIATLDDKEDSKKIIISDNLLAQLEKKSADMTYGKPLLSPYAEPEVKFKYHKDFQLKNGDNDVLFIKVNNNGKGEFFQLEANLSSNSKIFDGKNFKIGRIAPGESKSVRLPFSIPKNAQSSEIKVRINFSEANGYVPENISKSIIVKGQKPPRFVIGYHIVDDGTGNSIGNGDSQISKKESIDILLDVKNIGEAISENTKAFITAMEEAEGLKLNIKKALLGDIPKNDVVQGVFTITVQPSFTQKNIELLLAVQDEVYNTRLKKKIYLPLNSKIIPKYISNNNTLIVKADTNIYSRINDFSSYMTSFKNISTARSIGELKDWVKIQIAPQQLNDAEMLTGWIMKNNVISQYDNKTEIVKINNKKVPSRTIVISKSFPKIEVHKPDSKESNSKNKTILLSGTINDAYGIQKILFYLNDFLLKKISPLKSKNFQKKDFELSIQLNNGINKINIIAINVEKIKSNETYIINYTQ